MTVRNISFPPGTGMVILLLIIVVLVVIVARYLSKVKRKRLTVEFNTGMTILIRKMAKKKKIKSEDIVHRALACYFHVNEEVLKKPDRKLSIVSKKDKKTIQDIDLS